MAARSIWTGSISFGLVNIPVKMYTAVREERVSFRMLHDQDKVPLRQKMYCPADGKDVHPEHIVKGYEVEKGQFVVVQEEELEALEPKKTKTIEIQDFVDLDDIDPVYFDKSYYLAPTEQSARPYKLLVEALEKTQKVGIAKFVRTGREHLVALRAIGDGILGLETMHFSSEVADPDDIPGAPVPGKVEERELKMATHLIESLSAKFEPTKYRNEYRDRVLELVKKKAEGEQIHVAPAVEAKATSSRDLLAALEASIAEARGGGGGGGGAASHVGIAGALKTRHRSSRPKGETKQAHTRRRKSA